MDDFFKARRNKMVETQIISRGVNEPALIRALLSVPREEFVSEEDRDEAYSDNPLPIGEGQTISQPYVVALMIQALGTQNMKGHVLEVGAGSGYAAAILGRLANDVVAIERNPKLAKGASERIKRLGYSNVEVIVGDGSLGYRPQAPYDGILVSAGGPEIPKDLLDQLKIGGKLVIPIGDEERSQQLFCVTRVNEIEFKEEILGGVMFVPLIGAKGWPDRARRNRDAGD